MRTWKLAAACLVFGSMALGLAGCDKDTGKRVDMDAEVRGDRGLQSRDLREMTTRMAPDLLAIPEVAQNQFRAVVVMKSIENKLEGPDAGRSMDIYVARLKTLLNSSSARDRLAFVEERATLQRLQGEELGSNVTDPFEDASRGGVAIPPDQRVKPQYVLKGVFYSKFENKSTYYLCTFQLTDLRTGIQVWENSYEVQRLN